MIYLLQFARGQKTLTGVEVEVKSMKLGHYKSRLSSKGPIIRDVLQKIYTNTHTNTHREYAGNKG